MRRWWTVLLCLAPLRCQAQPVITTVAGTSWLFPADGIPAAKAPLGDLGQIAAGAEGRLWIADAENAMIFEVSSDGQLRIVAGNGLFGDDGTVEVSARGMRLFYPTSVAVDRAGNLHYTSGVLIRRLTPDGRSVVVAGRASGGLGPSSPDGTPSTSAVLNYPHALAFDNNGLLYFVEGNRIRYVDRNNQIQTFAGTGALCPGINQPGRCGDGGPARNATFRMETLGGIVFDRAGNAFIADSGNYVVRRVRPDGVISVFAGNGERADLERETGPGEGQPATSAPLHSVNSVAIDAAGALIIGTDSFVRRVGSDGRITTLTGRGRRGFSGDGGRALGAMVAEVKSVVAGADGSIFISDGNRRVRRLSPDGMISTYAGDGRFRFSGDGGRATVANLSSPGWLAVDVEDNNAAYISDGRNLRVRRVNPLGVVGTVAGSPGSTVEVPAASATGVPAETVGLRAVSGVVVDRTGALFIADPHDSRIVRVEQDNTIRDFARADRVGVPAGLALDQQGNLLVASWEVPQIRRLTPDASMTIIAGGTTHGFSGDGGPATSAQLNWPNDVAADRFGNIYIADQKNHRVRRVTPGGIISTFAGSGSGGFSGDGGPATAAALNNPNHVAVDDSGAVFISDSGNRRIRVVSSDGTISTIAGTGVEGFAGDGSLASQALFGEVGPGDLAFDGNGDLLVVDRSNHRVRKIVLRGGIRVSAAPLQLRFTARPGSSPSPEQTISLQTNLAGSTYTVVAATASGGRWLRVSPSTGTAPATLKVWVDPSQLLPATYSGTITISSPSASPARIEIPVMCSVSSEGIAGGLRIQPEYVALSAPPARGPVDRLVSLFHEGDSTVLYTASVADGPTWLAVQPASGSVAPGQPASVALLADPSNLPAGTHHASVVINYRTGTLEQRLRLPVVLTVSGVFGRLALTQTGLLFNHVAGGAEPTPQSVRVILSGPGRVAWTHSLSQSGNAPGWLLAEAVSASSGDAPGEIRVSVKPGSLEPGQYFGQVLVESAEAENSPQIVTVALNVLAPGSMPPPEASTTGLVFFGDAGTIPPTQELEIKNPAARVLNYDTFAHFGDVLTPWFTRTPPGGDSVEAGAAKRIVVRPDFRNLSEGIYRGDIVLSASEGPGITISIVAIVRPAPPRTSSKTGVLQADGCTPKKRVVQILSPGASFLQRVGDFVPVRARIIDDCRDPVTSAVTVVATVPNDAPRQGAAGDSAPTIEMRHRGGGEWEGTWSPRYPGSGVGVYVTVIGPRLGGIDPIADSVVTGTVLAPIDTTPPKVPQGGLRNSASLERTIRSVAPGTYITIFGDRLSDQAKAADGPAFGPSLEGVEVFIGNIRMALQYVSPNQINALVPYNISFNTEHLITVRNQGRQSLPEAVVVAPAQPAIFTTNQQGTGQGQIYEGDMLADSAAPVAAGARVTLFCTGLGPVAPLVNFGEPAPADVRIRTIQSVSLVIGGKAAVIESAGLRPGHVGVYQVTAIVPDGITPGSDTPVILTVAGQVSAPVTMAVR